MSRPADSRAGRRLSSLPVATRPDGVRRRSRARPGRGGPAGDLVSVLGVDLQVLGCVIVGHGERSRDIIDQDATDEQRPGGPPTGEAAPAEAAGAVPAAAEGGVGEELAVAPPEAVA